MTRPARIKLSVSFDLDQLTDQLKWHFRDDNLQDDDSGDDHNPDRGHDAGSVYFAEGETLRLVVTGGSYQKFETWSVLDCCLVSRPKLFQCGPLIKTIYPPPSPFRDLLGMDMNATFSFPADQFAGHPLPDKDPAYYKLAQIWKGNLTVGPVKGRWELSFILTVNIVRADGSSLKRVFYFDPESEIGTGANPPHSDEPGA